MNVVQLIELYLLSITEALTEIPNKTTAFVFASKGSKDLIGDFTWIPAIVTERITLDTTWLQLRGKQFQRFAAQVFGEELREVASNPQLVRELSS